MRVNGAEGLPLFQLILVAGYLEISRKAGRSFLRLGLPAVPCRVDLLAPVRRDGTQMTQKPRSLSPGRDVEDRNRSGVAASPGST
jgi:hypothetical protein